MLKDFVVANKSIIELDVRSAEKIDEIAIKVLMQDCPEFSLPIRKIEIDDLTKLRYEISGGVRLSYCPSQMAKSDFIKLLSGLLTPFKVCGDWFLNYHNIYLDRNYIFTSREYASVKFIYIPVADYAKSDEEIKSFFADIILWAEIVDDPGYTMSLLRIIRDENSNLMTLLDYVQQGQKSKELMETASCQSVNVQQGMESQQYMTAQQQNIQQTSAKPEQKKSEGGQFGVDNSMNNILSGLGGDFEEKPKKEKKLKEKTPREKKAGGLFGGLLGGKKEESSNPAEKNNVGAISQDGIQARREPAESLNIQKKGGMPVNKEFMNPIPADDKTVISDDAYEDPDSLYLSLAESAIGYDCPQLIQLNLAQGFATLGRRDKNGMAKTTYGFDSSLTFISRMHLRIEKTENGYNVIDTDSKGGTFLNGQRLAANIAYPMKMGDTLTFTNKHLSYRVSQ